MNTPTPQQLFAADPLVRQAARLANEAGEPSPLRVAEELLGLMNELEDRFPGLTFSEILRDPATLPPRDVQKLRNQLRRNGASQADIALVCPPRDSLLTRRNALAGGDPYSDTAFFL